MKGRPCFGAGNLLCALCVYVLSALAEAASDTEPIRIPTSSPADDSVLETSAPTAKMPCPTGWKLLAKKLNTVCYGTAESESPRANINDYSCDQLEVEVRQCDSDHLKGVIIGPMTNTVGQWTSIGMDLAGILKKGDRITEFVSGGIYPNGDPIKYPPLHPHHIHVLYPGTLHWFEVHGDYKITPESGGYSTLVPDGHCVVAGSPVNTDRFRLQALINDVRFEYSGSGMGNVVGGNTSFNGIRTPQNYSDFTAASTFEWYLPVVFKLKPLSEGNCTRVGKMTTNWPLSKYASNDYFGRYDVGNTRRIQWWTVRMQQAGRIVADSAYAHSHRARWGGMVVVAGKKQLYELTGINGACTIDNNCPSQAEVHRLLIDKAGDMLVCSDDPDVPFWEELPFQEEQGVGGYYSRRGKFSCKPYHFARHELLTIFSFDTPNWSLESMHFPQHTMIFSYYTLDDNEEAAVREDKRAAGWGETVDAFVMNTWPNSNGLWEPESGIYQEDVNAYMPMDKHFLTESEMRGITIDSPIIKWAHEAPKFIKIKSGNTAFYFMLMPGEGMPDENYLSSYGVVPDAKEAILPPETIAGKQGNSNSTMLTIEGKVPVLLNLKGYVKAGGGMIIAIVCLIATRRAFGDKIASSSHIDLQKAGYKAVSQSQEYTRKGAEVQDNLI